MSKARATQRRILAAAGELFAEKPFDSVSMRAIARRAEVDPALIHHYFGTKEDLFGTVLEELLQPEQLALDIAGHPREEWGRALVHAALTIWASAMGPAVLALFRTGLTSHPELLRDFVLRAILSQVIDLLDGDLAERELRATLTGSQIVGLLTVRHLVGVEPLASLPIDDLADAVGPTIQRYLTGDVSSAWSDHPEPTHPSATS